MNNNIRSMVLSFGADVCGIAAAKDLSNAPEGFRPTDIFEKCKSRIIRVNILRRKVLMKKVVISLISFVIVFITTYLILCYLPHFRIKLFAPPMEYFIESIKHMVFLKSLVSFVVGILTTGILFLIQGRTN